MGLNPAAQPQGKSVLGFIGNLGEDLLGTVKAMFWDLPLMGLRDIASGVAEAATLGKWNNADGYDTWKVFNAVFAPGPQESVLRKQYAQNYGSLGGFGNYVYEHPIQFLLDASAIAGAGAGIAGKVGQVGRLSEIAGLARSAAVGDVAAAGQLAAAEAKLSPIARSVRLLRDVRIAREALGAEANVPGTLGLSAEVTDAARVTQLKNLLNTTPNAAEAGGWAQELAGLTAKGAVDLETLVSTSRISTGAKLIDNLVARERLVAPGFGADNLRPTVVTGPKNPLFRIVQSPLERRFALNTIDQLEQKAARLGLEAAQTGSQSVANEARVLRDTIAKMREQGLTYARPTASYTSRKTTQWALDRLLGTRKSNFYAARDDVYQQFVGEIKGNEDIFDQSISTGLGDFNESAANISALPDYLAMSGYNTVTEAAAAIMSGAYAGDAGAGRAIVDLIKRGEASVEGLIRYTPPAELSAIAEHGALADAVRSAMSARGIPVQAQEFLLRQLDEPAQALLETGDVAAVSAYYADRLARFSAEFAAQQDVLIGAFTERLSRPVIKGAALSDAEVLQARAYDAFGESQSVVGGQVINDGELFLRIAESIPDASRAQSIALEAMQAFKRGEWGPNPAEQAASFAASKGLAPEVFRSIFDGTSPAPIRVANKIAVNPVVRGIQNYFDWASAKARRGSAPEAPKADARPGLAAIDLTAKGEFSNRVLAIMDRLNEVDTNAGRTASWNPARTASAVAREMRDDLIGKIERWRQQITESSDELWFNGRKVQRKEALAHLDAVKQAVTSPDTFAGRTERLFTNANFQAVYDEIVRRGANLLAEGDGERLYRRIRQSQRGEALFGTAGRDLVTLIEGSGSAGRDAVAASRVLEYLKGTDPAAYEDLIRKYGGDVQDVASPEYGISRRPGSPATGAPAYDLTKNGAWPEDIYSIDAPNQGYGVTADEWKVLKSLRGKPDAEITIYRAVPKDIPNPTIQPGDWVTNSKAWAIHHGGYLGGASDWDQNAFTLISKRVPASHIYATGEMLDEWGYWPSGVSEAGSSVLRQFASDVKAIVAGDTASVAPEIVQAIEPHITRAKELIDTATGGYVELPPVAGRGLDLLPPSFKENAGGLPVSTVAPTGPIHAFGTAEEAVGAARGMQRRVQIALREVFGIDATAEVMDPSALAGTDALQAWDLLDAHVTLGTWNDATTAVSRLNETGATVLGVYDLAASPNTFGERGIYALVEFPENPGVKVRVEFSTKRSWNIRQSIKAHTRVHQQNITALENARKAVAEGLESPDLIPALEREVTKGQRYLQNRWAAVTNEMATQMHGALPVGGKARTILENLRTIIDREFTTPMVENGFTLGQLFDREYLPLRLASGARWDPDVRGLIGGKDALTLDSERIARGLHAPIYFPSIDLRRIRPTDFLMAGARSSGMRAMVKQGFLERDTGYLMLEGFELADPLQAYAIRANAQLRYLDVVDFVKNITQTYGRRIKDQSELARGEVIMAPDGFLNAYNMKITVEDRIIATAKHMGENSPFTDAASISKGDVPEILTQGFMEMVDVEGLDVAELFDAVNRGMAASQKNVLALTKQGVELYAMPKVVMDRIAEHAKMAHFGSSSNMVNVLFQAGTQSWRSMVLVASPRWIINNLLTNILALKMQGGKLSDVLRQYLDPQYRQFLKELGGSEVGGSFMASERSLYRRMGTTADENVVASAIQKARDTRVSQRLNKAGDFIRRVNSEMEEAFRRASFVRAIDRQAIAAGTTRVTNGFWTSMQKLEKIAAEGITEGRFRAAVAEVNQMFNDYSALTPFEQHIVRRVIAPFYSWYKHIFKLTFTYPYKFPVRSRLMFEVGKLSEAIRQDQGEKPEWLDRALPFGVGGKWITSQGVLPFSQWAEDPISLLHPALKIALEQFQGRDSFTGRRFTDPNVVEAYGGQLFRIEFDASGQPRAVPIDKNAPGLGEHLLRQIPQYRMLRDVLGGGRSYDSASLFDVMQGKGTVMDATGQPALPTDLWQQLARYFGITVYDYDLAGWQKRMQEGGDQALKAWYERMGLMQ